jgi:GNAT superfamily N-acetyltransferase
MPRLYRTDASDTDFIELVALLDKELAETDGDEHSFYQQFNHIDHLAHIVLIKENNQAIGCGAIKVLDGQTMEVKRMFVLREMRGRGLAGSVLAELEKWALELGFNRCRLETGKRQPEAIALYKNKGYQRISNYGQYAEVINSICFEKRLKEGET